MVHVEPLERGCEQREVRTRGDLHLVECDQHTGVLTVAADLLGERGQGASQLARARGVPRIAGPGRDAGPDAGDRQADAADALKGAFGALPGAGSGFDP